MCPYYLQGSSVLFQRTPRCTKTTLQLPGPLENAHCRRPVFGKRADVAQRLLCLVPPFAAAIRKHLSGSIAPCIRVVLRLSIFILLTAVGVLRIIILNVQIASRYKCYSYAIQLDHLFHHASVKKYGYQILKLQPTQQQRVCTCIYV